MISSTAEYALRAVVWLAAHEGEVAPADRLAEATKIPRRYLHKVLQSLVHAKIVRSQPGPGGGYSLASHPDNVTVLDVINAVSPIERIKRCPLGLASHVSLCPLHAELDRCFEHTENALRRVTMGELIRSTSPIVPLCEV